MIVGNLVDVYQRASERADKAWNDWDIEAFEGACHTMDQVLSQMSEQALVEEVR